MYVVFIVDNIHHLLNECKIWNFAYICDRRMYTNKIVPPRIATRSNTKISKLIRTIVAFSKKIIN